MTDRKTLVREIATILDYPSVYMGAPSNRSIRYAEKIIELLDEHIIAAGAKILDECAAIAGDEGCSGAVERIRALKELPE
jgi:hypothetical protein